MIKFEIIEDTIIYLISMADRYENNLVHGYALDMVTSVGMYAVMNQAQGNYTIMDFVKHFETNYHYSEIDPELQAKFNSLVELSKVQFNAFPQR